MRKLENYTGEQARSYKKFAQHAKGDREDFEKDCKNSIIINQ